MKKQPGDIIILHLCTINDNHIMYGSWDMESDEQNFLSFWTIFCPFNPLTTRKIKILKKWKIQLEILSFYTCVPKMTIIWCMIPEMSSARGSFFCHFGPFFALLPEKSKFSKKMKKTPDTWRYHHFTILYQKSWSYAILFLKCGAWRM